MPENHFSKYQDQSDESIFNGYKNLLNMDGLAYLFEKYKTLIFGVSLKYNRSVAEAEDKTASIFELLLKKAAYHEVKNFKSWLYVLVKNHNLEQIRKNKKNLTISTDPGFMQSFDILHQEYEEEDVIYFELRKCMGKLASQQRKAIELFYEMKKSYKEIAVIEQLQVSSVRSSIQNARRNLKKCMEAKGLGK